MIEKTRKMSRSQARRLRRRIEDREATIRAQPRRVLGCLAGLSVVCALVFIVKPSDPVNQWGSIVLFGLFAALVAGIGLNVVFEERRKIKRLHDVLRDGNVVELTVTSERCFLILDEGHEEADCLFDVGNETLAVCDVSMNDRDLPNSDFVVFRIVGADGKVEDEWIRCRGDRLSPIEKLVRGGVPDSFAYDHLTLLPGTLDDCLRQANPSSE